MDLRDPKRLDFLGYVTAHELAHQYWFHQVMPADVQGAEVLTETLSQYSALMVMKHRYGPDQVRQFLKYEHDYYLQGRRKEASEEQPLGHVNKQGYIHYNKGSIVMYLLQDHLGEERVNTVLRGLVDRYRFKPAPYARASDLVDGLLALARTPQERELILDQFERITLYDLRAKQATVRRLPDGQFETTITVHAAKTYADGKGNEQPAEFNENVNVGVFTAQPGDLGFGRENVVSMQRLPIRSGEQQVRIVTEREPLYAGVDPYLSFIDRNLNDNVVSVADAPSAAAKSSALTYPEAKRGDQADDYHGVTVPDPYRWLEAADSAETQAWVAAQNKVTFGYLEGIPQRAALKERLTQLWNYERVGIPVKSGNRYFYTRNDGLQNQAVLYVADSLEAAPRVLLDPNKILADGTAALSGWTPSDDGKLLAYGVAEAGSDWVSWKVRDVATGADRDDQVKWTKFVQASWAKDGSGFYYGGFDQPKSEESLRGSNFFNKLYFHKLGDAQARDRLIYEKPEARQWMFNPYVSEDGHYLIVSIWRGSDGTNQIFYRDLQQSKTPVVELLAGFDAAYNFVGNQGGRFWFWTDLDAPNGRLVEIDIAKPARANWKTVIAEGSQALQSVTLVGDRFIGSYLEDAASQVKVFDLAGKSVGEVKAPTLGAMVGFEGKRGDTESFYAFTSFAQPATIYRYDVRTGQSSVFKQPKLAFDPAEYQTQRVFVTSKDGTRLPMFITHRRGVRLNGQNPTLLYAYGGFKISLTPGFSPQTLAFLERGGVYAQPSLRGGFEYGQGWHEAGMRANKQNVFDDFIASAQWLIANKYTQPAKLAIYGGSNGGLLVGAVMTQRPELFGAALPAVGVLDMLRFKNWTIGWAWADEYGHPDKAEDFAFLRGYSPLHNLRPGTKYPATLVTTGDHDDRVPPAHSYKFAAELQHDQAGAAPVLIRIDTRTGHGQGRPTSKQIELAADLLAFIEKNLRMSDNT